MARQKQATVTSRDPVTSYARAVLAGKIIAGPHVRDACRRHMQDLEEAPKRGFFFDRARVRRVIGFFQEVLHLNGGEFEGRPFHVIGWEAFVLGSLFGWVDAEGLRRFRTGYVETGKGSGKSPLAAGIGLYGLMADNEPRAEVYAAATKKDQAMILFRDAVAMVDQSPAITPAVLKSGSPGHEWNIAYLKAHAFFRPISADDSQSGPRPHIVLLDEIHEHKKGVVVNMMRAGTKSRRQALIFMITNSGADKQSICYEYHDYGAKVAAGMAKDDSFFAYICALDEGDDPMKDERCWHKANPSLKAGLPGLKYLREQVVEARGMPSKESVVRRINFCQWVGAIAPWIDPEVWFGAEDKAFDPALLRGRRCWAGLDLSSTQDLTALALLFAPTDADPVHRLRVWFWLPGDGLAKKAEKDRVPYVAWREAGFLQALPGRAVNKRAVARQLAEISAQYELIDVGYDRWRIEDFKATLDDEGIVLPLSPFGQGFKDMGPAVDEFERLLLNGEIKHDGNPVLTWCAGNVELDTDPAGNRKITKERATGRVDGIVAAVMAAGRAQAAQPEAVTVGMEVW